MLGISYVNSQKTPWQSDIIRQVAAILHKCSYHAPLSVSSPIRWLRRKNRGYGGRKSRKTKFPELGLPGVEILNGACTSILHLSRGSQSPYSEKSKKSEHLTKNIQNVDSAYLLPIFPVWSQPMGAHGTNGW